MTDDIQKLKEHRNLNKLREVLEKYPFGSTVAQITNDCRISVKTAKNLLAIADFVKKDGDLFFLKSDKQAQQRIMNNIMAKEPEPKPKKPEVEKEINNNRIFSVLNFKDIMAIDSEQVRLNAILCSNPARVFFTINSLISNFPISGNSVNEKLNTYIKYARNIINNEQNLLANRRSALKRLLTLEVFYILSKNIEIKETEFYHSYDVDAFYSDEIDNIISLEDFKESQESKNRLTDFFNTVNNDIEVCSFIDQLKKIKYNLEFSESELINIDSIDARTYACIISNDLYSIEELMKMTGKSVNRISEDARKIIQSPFISYKLKANAIKILVLSDGFEFGVKNVTLLISKAKKLVDIFNDCYYKKQGRFRKNPFLSEIFKPFTDALLKNHLDLKNYSLEQQNTPAPAPTLKEDVMSESQAIKSNSSDTTKKYSEKIKVKVQKTLKLTEEEVFDILKDQFDMQNVEIKRKGGAIESFVLTSDVEQ